MDITIVVAVITSVITIFFAEIIKYRFNLGVIGHKEKLKLYSEAISPFTNYLGKVTRHFKGWQNNIITAVDYNELDRLRLELHGRLGLFASLEVMKAYDNMCIGLRHYNDIILSKNKPSIDLMKKEWYIFTALALKWISAMRKDIGIRKDEVVYTGEHL